RNGARRLLAAVAVKPARALLPGSVEPTPAAVIRTPPCTRRLRCAPPRTPARSRRRTPLRASALRTVAPRPLRARGTAARRGRVGRHDQRALPLRPCRACRAG